MTDPFVFPSYHVAFVSPPSTLVVDISQYLFYPGPAGGFDLDSLNRYLLLPILKMTVNARRKRVVVRAREGTKRATRLDLVCRHGGKR